MSGKLLQALRENPEISAKQLEKIESLVNGGHPCTGELLLRRRLVTERQLMYAWSGMFGIPFQERLEVSENVEQALEQVPASFLKRFLIVPVSVESEENGKGSSCLIALNDPSKLYAADDLARLMGIDSCSFVLATRDSILSAVSSLYEKSGAAAEEIVRDMEESEDILDEIDQAADLLDDAIDAPIIKLVNYIVAQSVKAKASDIHIEAYQDSFKIRYRIDGILYDFLSPPKRIQPALVSRIKVMANMNIAEKRLPQDGRMQVRLGDAEIDIRVSSIPITAGERLVLRLLNKSSTMMELKDLGFSSENYEIYNRLIRYSNGIILVTGPTGSGKTTTLYATLSTINKPEINIITIEDPVEYQISGINQIQVNQKIGLTFAKGLRSIVRQDPDVILVGEIRDQETAEIAVQSALTGHLVFSTLHTNDSASAVTRLVDIGIEPFLISSSVIAVIAQRLVRVLCPECREGYVPDREAIKSIGASEEEFDGRRVYRSGGGCQNCMNTGYKGRIGIFEIMVLDDVIKKMILSTHDSDQIKAEAVRRGMTTLRHDGIRKIIEGVTSIEEVLRVTQR